MATLWDGHGHPHSLLFCPGGSVAQSKEADGTVSTNGDDEGGRSEEKDMDGSTA